MLITVLIPICFILVVSIFKQIPKIGGNVIIALAGAGALALLLGGVYSPLEWITAWIDGIDRLSWILWIMIIGSIYATSQVRLGTFDTILQTLRAIFGDSPKALATIAIIALMFAGSFIGDGTATLAVVGLLLVKPMYNLRMPPNLICGILVGGAALGSLLPPISQAFFLSASLLDTDPDSIIGYGFITVPLAGLIFILFVNYVYIRDKYRLPDVEPVTETAGSILKKRYYTLLPLVILIFLVVLRSGPIEKLQYDLITNVINLIQINGQPILNVIGEIPIVGGLTTGVVLLLIFVFLLTITFFPVTREKPKELFLGSLKNIFPVMMAMLAAAFLIGAFYKGGQVDMATEYALSLSKGLVKIGGVVAMIVMGMLTGSQATAQSIIGTFFGPIMIEMGIPGSHAGIILSHLATAGQDMPPIGLGTFVTASMISAILGRKIDPLRSMYYTLPMSLTLLLISLFFLFILN